MSIPDPMLATPSDINEVEHYINDDNWVLEQKLDGHRVRWDLTAGTFSNRNGDPYTKDVPNALRYIPSMEGGWVLDGELVDGQFYAFDILQHDSNLSLHKLHERREILEAMVQALQGLVCVLSEGKFGLTKEEYEALPIQIVPQAATAEAKRDLVDRVVSENLEGVVAKYRDSVYRAGRQHNWMKIKVSVTADVVVLSIHSDGKENATLGIVQNNRLVEVGKCSLIGKPPVKPGDVVEVRYLYMTADGRLYQPRLERVRFDKTAQQCDGRDFRVVNKSVITSL